ncbi:MAG: YceI family protein [Gammaproteobacteria bacterium]
MKKTLLILLTVGCAFVFTQAQAADYKIDSTHSFVEFRIQHLGYSWMYGRFNGVEGEFSYDAGAPEDSKISVVIDTTSIDTNHAERDKHLRGDDFLEVNKFGQATFTSTSFKDSGDTVIMTGVLDFHGVKKTIEIPVTRVGEGDDPWGGYRAGFHGTYTMTRADFGVDYELGPASTTVELQLSVEGVRQ